jgi:hypothetical protein
MTTILPTDAPHSGFIDQSWATETWAKFDYYQNPVRDAGAGNPCCFAFNAGGSEVGSHKYYRASTDTEWWHFMRWLLGDFDPVRPLANWDFCAITIGQRKHTQAAIERSRMVIYPDNVKDPKRAIASVKSLAATYGFDPDRCGALGESYGAWAVFLSQLDGGPYLVDDEDSRLRFFINSGAPIDFRNFSGTDYFDWRRIASMMGVRADLANVEWDLLRTSLKNRASIRWWIENGYLTGYAPTYNAYVQRGDGVKPLGNQDHVGSDPHDSSQVTDITTALANAGLVQGTDFESEILTTTALSNTNYPAAPSGLVLEQYQRVEAFMALNNA